MPQEPQTIYLSLGSNVGNRQAFLKQAVSSLPPKVLPVKCSALYETKPWGFEEQADFLNLALEAKTDLSPRDLLHYLKDIETAIGRKASFTNGPREIDIDILFYANQVLEHQELIIPHPHLHQRAFVLGPLAEIAPDLIHPGLSNSVSQLKESIDMRGIQRLSETEFCTEIATY